MNHWLGIAAVAIQLSSELKSWAVRLRLGRALRLVGPQLNESEKLFRCRATSKHELKGKLMCECAFSVLMAVRDVHQV
jgi:hypothetical protein